MRFGKGAHHREFRPPDRGRTKDGFAAGINANVRLIMAANERAKYFVSGKGFESELAASFPVGAGDDIGCRVLVRLPWTDAGRSSRALQMIDTELRRAARALTTAVAGDEDLDLFPAESDGDGDGQRLRDALLNFPTPDARGAGHLEVISAVSSPLRLLLEPTGSVADLLGRHPLAAATFAMSVFGMRMTVTERRDARFEAVEFGAPDAARDAMDRALLHGEWSGSRVGRSTSYVSHGRPGLFRGVSGATTAAGGENYASLGLYLFSPNLGAGYFVTVRLLEMQSSTTDFGERLPFM